MVEDAGPPGQLGHRRLIKHLETMFVFSFILLISPYAVKQYDFFN